MTNTTVMQIGVGLGLLGGIIALQGWLGVEGVKFWGLWGTLNAVYWFGLWMGDKRP